VKRLNAAGVPSGVLAAPLLPGLSDADDQVAAVVRAAEDAGATFVTPMLLYLTPPMKRHWMAWLKRHRPELVGRYADLYRNRSRLQSVSITPRNRWEKRTEPARTAADTTEQLGLFDDET
jgi:DNA repair photolyase